MDFKHILNYRLIELESFQMTVAGVLVMVLILVATRVALSVFRRMLFRNMDNSVWDRSRRESMYLLVKYVAWTLAIALAIQAVGVKITLLLAGSAALLVGLGLGVQRIFSDIVSGIFLLFEGTIRLDDIIEVDGMVCRVKGINLRTSRVERLKSDLRFDVFASLKRAGITIPYPQRDLHIKELPDGLRGRPA